MMATGPGIVVGIGQCCWDYLAAVDSYPAVDEKQEITTWTEQGGGPVATAVVTLCRLGVHGCFYGIVGDDPLGERVRVSLEDEGVDVSGMIVRSGARSQVAFIVVERGSGKRTVFWQRPTGAPLLPGELPPAFLEGAGFLLLDGLMSEISLHAAILARQRGVPVMLDAGRVRPGMVELARHCDYLVAGERFAHDLGWDLEPEPFAREAVKTGARVVTVTRGNWGSITWSDGEVFHTPAFPVDAVDTTGAGDVFHGGYACGVLHGWPLRATLVFASAVAAMKCTAMGGRTAIPSFSAATAFLAARGIDVSVYGE